MPSSIRKRKGKPEGGSKLSSIKDVEVTEDAISNDECCPTIFNTILFMLLSIAVSISLGILYIDLKEREMLPFVLLADENFEDTNIILPLDKDMKEDSDAFVIEDFHSGDKIISNINSVPSVDKFVEEFENRLEKDDVNILSDSKDSDTEDEEPINIPDKKVIDNKDTILDSSVNMEPVIPQTETISDTVNINNRPVDLNNKTPISPMNNNKEIKKTDLRDLYLEVESLADDILSEDPNNEKLKSLSPLLEKILNDMEQGKYSGLEDALTQVKNTLETLKDKLSQTGVSDLLNIVNDSSEKDDLPPPIVKEEDKEFIKDSLPPNDGKTPVEEVIPDPVHIEPLGKNEPKKEIPSKKIPKKENGNSHFKKTLKEADSLVNKDPEKSDILYDTLLKMNPKSVEALYGHAKALEVMAEREKSNSLLEQSIVAYRSILELGEREKGLVSDDIYQKVGLLCSNLMAFRGWRTKSVKLLQEMIDKFPQNTTIQNKLGVGYLLMNQPVAAFDVFKSVLTLNPNDGFAMVHYGFIMKTTFNNNTEAVKYMEEGIRSNAEGTDDGRFYFHLGDALQRLGRSTKAYEIYDEGVKKGFFKSRYQRSLYNVDRLSSRPIWKKGQTPYVQFFKKLESHWKEIKEEGLKLLSSSDGKSFIPEAENLRDKGDWQQFDLFVRGKIVEEHCARVPKTCALIKDFEPAAACKRGQVKFSIMQPGTHVWSHTGPTNCRLRAHLGLVVPSGLKLRVAEEFITWEEGKFFIFDDSFEHEVWHEGESFRLILIVDVWHPELTEKEKQNLSSI